MSTDAACGWRRLTWRSTTPLAWYWPRAGNLTKRWLSFGSHSPSIRRMDKRGKTSRPPFPDKSPSASVAPDDLSPSCDKSGSAARRKPLKTNATRGILLRARVSHFSRQWASYTRQRERWVGHGRDEDDGRTAR